MILTHGPFQPTPESPDWDPRAVGEGVNQHVKHFAEMTAYMDRMVGRLVARLDELGIRDRTLDPVPGRQWHEPGRHQPVSGEDYPGGKETTTRRGTHCP